MNLSFSFTHEGKPFEVEISATVIPAEPDVGIMSPCIDTWDFISNPGQNGFSSKQVAALVFQHFDALEKQAVEAYYELED